MKKKLITLLLAVATVSSLAACTLIGGGTSTDSVSSSVTSESVAVHKHQCKKIVKKEATCETEGNIEYWACIGCDKLFKERAATTELTYEEVMLPELAHEAVFVAEKTPSCSKSGNISYWVCDNCNHYFEDEACETKIEDKSSVVLAKTSHDLTHTEAVAPSGKNDGNIEYWYCSSCEKYYEDEACTLKITLEDTVVLSTWNISDFVVEVDEGNDPVVLQLSDTQIIDAAQARPGRTGVDYTNWATDKMDERCYNYLTEVITATNPDFIIITGDVVYGEFDDNGSALLKFVEFMDSFKIYWSPVFGNHDNESKMGVDWQCQQFENAEYCLFEQKTLTGNGNYSVAIAQGGELKRVFYMLDSNGCGKASEESKANGHTAYNTVGFAADQIAWYTKQITALKEASPNTKISFAYHIQQSIFGKAYEKYGFAQSESYPDINIDTLEGKADTDFGYIGRPMKGPWDANNTVYNGMKALGVDSIFVGHEHCNSASVVYDGIRFQFGQKSSEYDRFNCIDNNGNISGGYSKTGTSLIGGTVIPLSEEDGSILNPYIYYCGFENGQIDWEDYVPIEVSGLQYGGVGTSTAELWADGAVVAEGVKFDETTNAYAVTANNQGKLYVNTNLLRGKTTFTFTVYMPSTATAKLGGYGQFAIRTKPNDAEPNIDGSIDGYIDYDTSSTVDSLTLKYDEWQTFTVDISQNADVYTEFAFVIAKGNTIYLKDISVS